MVEPEIRKSRDFWLAWPKAGARASRFRASLWATMPSSAGNALLSLGLLREPDAGVVGSAPHDAAVPQPPAVVEAEVERMRQSHDAGKLDFRALGADVAHDTGNDRLPGRENPRAFETLCPRKSPPLLHGQPPMKISLQIVLVLIRCAQANAIGYGRLICVNLE